MLVIEITSFFLFQEEEEETRISYRKFTKRKKKHFQKSLEDYIKFLHVAIRLATEITMNQSTLRKPTTQPTHYNSTEREEDYF